MSAHERGPKLFYKTPNDVPPPKRDVPASDEAVLNLLRKPAEFAVNRDGQIVHKEAEGGYVAAENQSDVPSTTDQVADALAAQHVEAVPGVYAALDDGRADTVAAVDVLHKQPTRLIPRSQFAGTLAEARAVELKQVDLSTEADIGAGLVANEILSNLPEAVPDAQFSTPESQAFFYEHGQTQVDGLSRAEAKRMIKEAPTPIASVLETKQPVATEQERQRKVEELRHELRSISQDLAKFIAAPLAEQFKYPGELLANFEQFRRKLEKEYSALSTEGRILAAQARNIFHTFKEIVGERNFSSKAADAKEITQLRKITLSLEGNVVKMNSASRRKYGINEQAPDRIKPDLQFEEPVFTVKTGLQAGDTVGFYVNRGSTGDMKMYIELAK